MGNFFGRYRYNTPTTRFILIRHLSLLSTFSISISHQPPRTVELSIHCTKPKNRAPSTKPHVTQFPQSLAPLSPRTRRFGSPTPSQSKCNAQVTLPPMRILLTPVNAIDGGGSTAPKCHYCGRLSRISICAGAKGVCTVTSCFICAILRGWKCRVRKPGQRYVPDFYELYV